MKNKQKLGVIISTRLTAEHFYHIAAAARRRGMTVSAFVRAAAIEAANSDASNGSTGWGATVIEWKKPA